MRLRCNPVSTVVATARSVGAIPSTSTDSHVRYCGTSSAKSAFPAGVSRSDSERRSAPSVRRETSPDRESPSTSPVTVARVTPTPAATSAGESPGDFSTARRTAKRPSDRSKRPRISAHAASIRRAVANSVITNSAGSDSPIRLINSVCFASICAFISRHTIRRHISYLQDARPKEAIAGFTPKTSAVRTTNFWWALPGSNRRHPRCKRGALPAELKAPKAPV